MTPAERLFAILTKMVAMGADPDDGTTLCRVGAEILAVSGVGFLVVAAPRPPAPLCSTDGTSKLIEELQITLGEGPCIDALEQGQQVSEPDLAGAGRARWPAFSPAAIEAGARAVYGFPMVGGRVCAGAMNVYAAAPLSEEQHADALALAGVGARTVLAMPVDPVGTGQAGPAGINLPNVVHQAAGMVSVQLGADVDEALLRLRAHAFAHDRRLDDVARDVVARRLRFPQE